MSEIDNERWQYAKDKIIGTDRLRQQIGTLSEKTVHAVVKNYYELDEDYQEIPVEGKVADIFTSDEKIIEIQSRSFSVLKPKLDVFLPKYDVTLVHPVPDRKQIIWIDPDTGELCKPSPARRTGSIYKAFVELYSIRDYLDNPNLHIRLLQMDMIEYKLLSGRSKDRKKYGAVRFDRIPTDLVAEIVLDTPEDYRRFIPEELPEEFISKDFQKIIKASDRATGCLIGILRNKGLIEKIGTKNRAYLYKRSF